MQKKNATSGYYNQNRDELSASLPGTFDSVLDVGCGSGKFAETLKRVCSDATVIGIELEPAIAEKAKENLDEVYCGDAIAVMGQLSASGHEFSLICFNDVLEHLVNPGDALELAGNILSKNGSILLSVPNIRYVGNLYHLIWKKDWKYEESGIRDITHLRFYTEKSIIDFVKERGFEVQSATGANPTKSLTFMFLSIISMGWLSDCRCQNIVLRITPNLAQLRLKETDR